MTVFLANAHQALEQVVILYVIVAVGVIADKLGWFTDAIARTCTHLLFYVITPAVILRSFFQMKYSPEAAKGLLISVGCGMLLHLVGILLSEPFFRGSSGRHPEDCVLHFAAIYGNCGYMALPLAQAMVGEEGVFYCSAVILTFQVFSFTHGAFMMAGGVLGRKGEGESRFEWKRLVLNAGTLSVLAGLPFFLLGISLPRLVTQPVDYLASMNTPLAMLVFGTYLSKTNLRSVRRGGKLLLAMGIKLFGIPAVVLGVLLLAGVCGPLLHALLISASAPSANNTVVFAAKYGRDPGYAAQVVGLISVLSIVTMPLVIALGLQTNT
ncbi:MAG: AEC family transporter [Oscillospiraceae bacterium]|jgi:predicted permease|nr:AEC family transporter [Oscillospiraceae bacterium]